MARKGTLVTSVADDLRRALLDGTYPPGAKLPTESDLATSYGVSRPTVRAALRELEAKGLVRTQHGVGTFVLERPKIRAGLERLESITESIRAMGREPGMQYTSRVVRPLLPDEAEKLGLAPSAEAIEIRRSILADDIIVAYSYDLIPMEILPAGFDPADLDGSLFQYLRRELNLFPHHAVAEIHAVHSEHVGWDDPERPDLYLLLAQLHYDASGTVLMYSRTYFIEGRYEFSMLRTI